MKKHFMRCSKYSKNIKAVNTTMLKHWLNPKPYYIYNERMRYLIFISEIYDYNKNNENSCVSKQYVKRRRFLVVYVYIFIYMEKASKCRHVYYAIFSKSLYNAHWFIFCYFMDLRLSTIDIINTMHTQCNQHNDVDSFMFVIINMFLRINKVINIIRNQLF